MAKPEIKPTKPLPSDRHLSMLASTSIDHAKAAFDVSITSHSIFDPGTFHDALVEATKAAMKRLLEEGKISTKEKPWFEVHQITSYFEDAQYWQAKNGKWFKRAKRSSKKTYGKWFHCGKPDISKMRLVIVEGVTPA